MTKQYVLILEQKDYDGYGPRWYKRTVRAESEEEAIKIGSKLKCGIESVDVLKVI